MATFEAQVEGLTGLSIGTSPTTTELSQFLQDGVKEVVNRIVALNPGEIPKFTTTTRDTDGTGVVLKGKILSVVREAGDPSKLYACVQISTQDRWEATEKDSFKFRSKFNPAYYIQDGKIFGIPDYESNGFIHVTQVTYDTAIVYTSSAIEDFPDEYEYLVALNAACKSITNALSTKNDLLPSDVSNITLNIVGSSLPTFVSPPGFVLPASLSASDVDFSSVGSIESFISPAFVAPTLASISSMSLPAAPVAPTLDSSSIDTSGLTNPTFTAPVMNAPDWSDSNTWITTEEDSEMSAARVQEISGKISEFSARMSESVARFEKENSILQKDLQVAMQNANTFEQGKLSKYGAELQSYQSQVNTEIQKWTNETFGKEFQEWSQKYQGQLASYGSDVQKEVSRVSASVDNFQAQVGKALQKYQAETGYDVGKYQAEVQANVQQFQSGLVQKQADFDTSLQKYSMEFQKVSADNQSKLGKFSTDIQNYSAQLGKAAQDYEWLQGRYMILKQEYESAFQYIGADRIPNEPVQNEEVSKERR